MTAEDDRSPSPVRTASSPSRSSNASSSGVSLARSAIDFAKQAERLSHKQPVEGTDSDVATEARFVTPFDPVIVTSEGHRLPAVPLEEAHKLNMLREEVEGDFPRTIRFDSDEQTVTGSGPRSPDERKSSSSPDTLKVPKQNGKTMQKSGEGSLRRSMPPSHTNPLFPPLPLYGPPSLLRNIQCYVFRVVSFFLSLDFLAVIVLGALFTSIGPFFNYCWQYLLGRDPNRGRPFYEEEMRQKKLRTEMQRTWKRRRSQERVRDEDTEDPNADSDGFVPTEGGPDPIKCDVAYYARRVGLDVEEFEVQTEDGFIIDLWHVYDPREYHKLDEDDRSDRGPDLFTKPKRRLKEQYQKKPKFPVLLIHGLLQSAGAYCVNDDQSLAFYLCKSGYDVWLGNNRCGFKPKHVLLDYSDPRKWCWNIRQMGIFDLPALASRVLYETGFEKIGLICHSQGTTQTFVALAKEQRPELGEKLTVFCALAPAVYAGPLIGKMYFKFMRVITPAMFRLMFGIHAFIPFMMTMHKVLHPRVYGWLGYKVFSFLFNWTDTRWDRGLRDRMFQFAPVYVSAESMRWWLGRECFAKHKCILATKEEWRAEEREDNEADDKDTNKHDESAPPTQPPAAAAETAQQHPEKAANPGNSTKAHDENAIEKIRRRPRGARAWYDERAPPFAMWVCGNDDLVDGQKLLRRFVRGREPHVRVVHTKVIPEYEHLDVIWAMDAVDKVFGEVREVLWKTCTVRDLCRTPVGCEGVAPWVHQEVPADMDEEEEDDDDDDDSI